LTPALSLSLSSEQGASHRSGSTKRPHSCDRKPGRPKKPTTMFFFIFLRPLSRPNRSASQHYRVCAKMLMNISKYWESLHPAPHPAASSYPRRDGIQPTKNCATGARALKRRLLQIVTECPDSPRRSSAYSSRLCLGACGYLCLYLGSCG
jgi:hypothetical protein